MASFSGLCAASWGNDVNTVQKIVDTHSYYVTPMATDRTDSRGYAPLHYAAACGNLDVANHLLSANHGGIDTRDANGNTPLLWATMQGHEEMFVTIIDSGANVNCQNFVGETPLFIAANNSSVAMVQYLLEYGANPNIPTLDGTTPLQAAICTGNMDLIVLLMANGSQVNQADEEGDTPLHFCVREGTKDILSTLLDHGADVTVRNSDGETAIDLAQECGSLEFVAVLKQYLPTTWTAPHDYYVTAAAEPRGTDIGFEENNSFCGFWPSGKPEFKHERTADDWRASMEMAF